MKKQVFPVAKIILSITTIPLWFVKMFVGVGKKSLWDAPFEPSFFAAFYLPRSAGSASLFGLSTSHKNTAFLYAEPAYSFFPLLLCRLRKIKAGSAVYAARQTFTA